MNKRKTELLIPCCCEEDRLYLRVYNNAPNKIGLDILDFTGYNIKVIGGIGLDRSTAKDLIAFIKQRIK